MSVGLNAPTIKMENSLWDSGKYVINATVNNRLLWISTEVVGTAAFSAVVLTGVYTLPVLVFRKILIAAGAVILGQVWFFRKELIYRISLLFCLARCHINADKHHWADCVYDNKYGGKIILGALPLKSHGHFLEGDGDERKLRQAKICPDVVVSALEKFEFDAVGFFFQPWKHSELSKLNIQGKKIEVKHIEARDYFGLGVEQLHQGVRIIDEGMQKNKRIYVHCKEGVGRSPSIVICYFLYKGMANEVGAAITRVDKVRKLSLNRSQRAAIEAYYQAYCKK